MDKLKGLKPEKVFYFFEEISKIPRGSGNEKAISEYVCKFAEERGLSYSRDEANNVVIRKSATEGYENAKGVILQGHMDMVCEKNADCEHNFLSDPIDIIVDGDYIRANGTTLGADNGIGVAFMLAALDDDSLKHPPLECLFTSDEEVGMKGVKALADDALKGSRLINLDTEEEGRIIVSCCGGMKITAELPVKRESASGAMYSLAVKGLLGGHSGADIHLFRANAIKVIARAIRSLAKAFPVKLCAIYGGLADNAIPREAVAELIFDKNYEPRANEILDNLCETIKKEFLNEKTVEIKIKEVGATQLPPMDDESANKTLALITAVPYGVIRMSEAMPGLVETSNNIGIIKTENDKIVLANALRSSVSSVKQEIYDEIELTANAIGARTFITNEYPSWEFARDSELLKIMEKVYEDMRGEKPAVEAIHAGLECGLLGKKFTLDMASIGPETYDVHTPDERVCVSSAGRVWDYLKNLLANLK